MEIIDSSLPLLSVSETKNHTGELASQNHVQFIEQEAKANGRFKSNAMKIKENGSKAELIVVDGEGSFEYDERFDEYFASP